jgi:hypothetical protein
MTTEELREMTQFETNLILKILRSSPETADFEPQLAVAKVWSLDDYGSLAIRTPDDLPNSSSAPMTKIPPEGQASDADGIDVHFLLFQRGGSLCELQIYKDDGSPISRTFEVDDIETMTVG